jgi:hypothetical protein
MFKAKLVQYRETLPVTDNNADRALFAKNDNFRFEHQGYYPLLDHGTYYYPAWKHYNRKTSVFCDRCHRQNLRACIGYANFDLCLLCVDELTRLNFDCPSRHCHESKFINDNSVSFTRPEYVDLNRYYYHQHYDIKGDDTTKKDKKENFENTENNNNKTEHFALLKKNDIFKEKNIAIFIIIVMIVLLFCQK